MSRGSDPFKMLIWGKTGEFILDRGLLGIRASFSWKMI